MDRSPIRIYLVIKSPITIKYFNRTNRFSSSACNSTDYDYYKQRLLLLCLRPLHTAGIIIELFLNRIRSSSKCCPNQSVSYSNRNYFYLCGYSYFADWTYLRWIDLCDKRHTYNTQTPSTTYTISATSANGNASASISIRISSTNAYRVYGQPDFVSASINKRRNKRY
jgi:hypothetical protein